MFNVSPYDKKQKKKLVALAKKLKELYEKGRFSIYRIGADGKLDSRGWYLFENDQLTQRRVDEAMKQLHDDIVKVTKEAQLDACDISVEKNTALVKYMGIRNADDIIRGISPRTFKALESFQKRKVAGMNLSDRVWNYTDQFKQEMELVLQVGIADGIPASEMARELRQYLNEPNRLFRRVMDENGILRLSKNAMAYHPGAGIYRSSYQNALRTAMTETNIAYRTADHENWKAFDFVTGIQVRTSQSNHGTSDICDDLAGVYPKDFKFTGWHPRCRCHAIPLTKTREEMAKDDERILEGKEPLPSKNEVRELPKNYTDWMEKNAEKLKVAEAKGKLPYFVKDNKKLMENPPKAMTTMEKAKVRHESRTEKQVADIKHAWNERKAVIEDGKYIKMSNGIKGLEIPYKGIIEETDNLRSFGYKIDIDKSNVLPFEKFNFLQYHEAILSSVEKHGFSFKKGKIHMDGKYTTYRGVFRNAEGSEIILARSMEMTEKGKKIVYNEIFEIDKEFQGVGISKDIFKKLHVIYKNSDIDEIRLMANMEVGGYAWARYGFWTSDKQAIEIIKNCGKISEKRKQELIDIVKKHTKKGRDTNFPMYELAKEEDSKKFLLGTEWSGSLNMKDKDVMSNFEEYLGLK